MKASGWIPRTKAEAAAFAITIGAVGAFIMVVAGAIQMIACPVIPPP